MWERDGVFAADGIFCTHWPLAESDLFADCSVDATSAP